MPNLTISNGTCCYETNGVLQFCSSIVVFCYPANGAHNNDSHSVQMWQWMAKIVNHVQGTNCLSKKKCVCVAQANIDIWPLGVIGFVTVNREKAVTGVDL